MFLNRIIPFSKNASVNSSINGSLLMRYYAINLNECLKKSIYQSKSETTITPRLKANIPLIISTRNTGFYNKYSADELWKSITSVSSAGLKKGRARGKKSSVKNLNIGQIIGVGETNVQFPGLNAPLHSNNKLTPIKEGSKDQKREEKLMEIRNSMGKFKRTKLNPLERGWTSVTWSGKNIGAPVSQEKDDADDFAGFNTVILESKTVKRMTGNFGQKRRSSMFVVAGNGKGCAGFTLVKGSSPVNAKEKALKKVGQYLLHIDICEGHTVYHDFYCEFMYTKIFVQKKPEGYGLRCHRVLQEICKVLGIENLRAKVEGSMNTQNMTKAFFLGLLNQKTYQQMADEKQLIVARIRPGMPAKVLAKPSNGYVRSNSEILEDEELNINRYGMEGKVEIEKKKYVPFYERLPSFETHLKKYEKSRNHEKIKRQLELEYGEVRSFLTEKYPECKPSYRPNTENE